MKESIQTKEAPAAIGPYSQAVRSDKTIYFSGQIPLIPHTMELVSGSFQAQVKQVFSNLEAVCKAAGGDLSKIVKLTIFMTDLSHFQEVNDEMAKRFSEPYPARSTVQVSALPKAAQVEVEAIMVVS